MKAERIKGLCEIRTALLEVINIQSHEYDPLDLQKAQDTLNQVYDRFVAKYGAINSKGNILAFSDDDQFPLLRSIEDERKDKTGWDKSAIFTKATIRPFRQVNHADTAEDALQICLNHKLRVDLPYMSFLTGKEPEELVRELDTRIYLNPQKYYGNPLEGWELAEEYLSGHVRDKLLYARQKAAEEPELFARNVEALEEVQPEPLTPADIEVNMGAIWVPIEYYRQFMYETFQTSGYEKVIEGGDNRHRIDIEYFSYTTTWRVTNKNAEPDSVMVNQTFGTKRKNAYEIFEDCLNMQSSTVRDRQEYINENGNKSVKYVINAQETMIARAKQQQIQEAFASWVWKEPERRDTLLRIYNETFNTVRPREFDGSHLVFPGMNTEMKLRKHQLDFAARVIYTGTGLAAHEVGAGKTAALIAAGMYLKNLGAIHKAVFVVPNPLVGQWATEFYRFFPNANLLVKWHTPSEPQDITIYVSTNKGSLSQSTIQAKVVDLSGNDPPDPKATDTMGSWTASSVPSRETKTYAAWSVWWARWHPYWVWHSTGDDDGYWVDEGWYDFFRDNYSASMTATTRIEPDEKVPTASGDLMKSGYGVTNTVKRAF